MLQSITGQCVTLNLFKNFVPQLDVPDTLQLLSDRFHREPFFKWLLQNFWLHLDWGLGQLRMHKVCKGFLQLLRNTWLHVAKGGDLGRCFGVLHHFKLHLIFHGQKLVLLLRVEAIRVHQFCEELPQLLLQRDRLGADELRESLDVC